MSRRRRRAGLAAGILILWVGVLAWHVRREYFRPLGVRLTEASASLSPATSFYSVRLGDETIGFASSSIDTLPDGFQLTDDLRLRVRALGTRAPARAMTRMRLGRSLGLQEFSFSLASEVGDFRVTGATRGDSALTLKIAAGGDEQESTIATNGPVLLSQMMPLRMVLGGNPEPGATYRFEIFDPSILDRQRVDVRVLGRETRVYPDSAVFDTAVGRWVPATTDTVETWHVAERYGGVEIESWLDPDGRVVRATSPLGYTMERTAFEIAWNAYRAIESTGSASRVPDIIEGTAISSGATLPAVGTLGRLTVRLRNVDLSGFDLAGGRQEIHGDTLVVEREGAPLTAAYELPADSARWAAALAPTPLIQVNDPKIRARAREIVGDERDPVRAARLLTDWVYRALDKRVTLSVPSARQVLEAGRGDCNEHTVLYVALARAVGLPTRTATGLVHVRGRFYFHAWPEVWLGRWVAVDPTLGQFPADASHLRFVIGGLARQVELVRLIGSLQVDVLDAEGP